MAHTEPLHGLNMNGYIIETTSENEGRQGRRQKVRWIGIMGSVKDLIAILPGDHPSVLDRGSHVLWRAQTLGLRSGEFRELKE